VIELDVYLKSFAIKFVRADIVLFSVVTEDGRHGYSFK